MVTILAVVYCVARILMVVDSRLAMNGENDNNAIVVGYRLVIGDVVQLLEEQELHRERMNWWLSSLPPEEPCIY